jgi:hypothetical protein
VRSLNGEAASAFLDEFTAAGGAVTDVAQIIA